MIQTYEAHTDPDTGETLHICSFCHEVYLYWQQASHITTKHYNVEGFRYHAGDNWAVLCAKCAGLAIEYRELEADRNGFYVGDEPNTDVRLYVYKIGISELAEKGCAMCLDRLG